MFRIHHSASSRSRFRLFLELRHQPRGDHCALILLEVPSSQIRGDDDSVSEPFPSHSRVLVVNIKPQLSREQRRWLRAVKHHLKTGKPATLSEQQLKGWQSYQRSIEKVANSVEKRTYPIEKNKTLVARRKKRQTRRRG